MTKPRLAAPWTQRMYLSLRARANRRVAEQRQRRGFAHEPPHLLLGERGEELAFLHLLGLGYTVVARRWRCARLRGDLDLVAWDGDTLVIFEVKTRSERDFAPAASAVDRDKQQMLRRMASAYRGRFPQPWREAVPVRFDLLSVYDLPTGTEFEHVRAAFLPHGPGIQA